MSNTINVVGVGQASVMPNQASFTAVIEHEADQADTAYVGAAAGLSKIVDALEEAGVARSELRSTGVRVGQETRWVGKDDAPQTYFEGTGGVTVTVADLLKVGSYVIAAVRAGATRLDTIDYSVSDRAALRERALIRAAENARASADLLATTLGRSVGQAVEITRDRQPGVAFAWDDGILTEHRMSFGEEAPAIPSEITEVESVTVTFTLV